MLFLDLNQMNPVVCCKHPENGAPGEVRTPNPVFRRHGLYPIELQVQKKMVRQSGIEPLTRNLEGYWSIRLTYWRISVVDRRGFEPRTHALKGRYSTG